MVYLFRSPLLLGVLMKLYPLWTLKWHSLHRGICFLLILEMALLSEFNLSLTSLIFLRWCISISPSLPQLAHGSPNLSLDLILQDRAENGLQSFSSPMNLMGVLFESNFTYCIRLSLSLMWYIAVISFPNLLRKAHFCILSFLLIVFLRLSLSIQWTLLSLDLLSTKL